MKRFNRRVLGVAAVFALLMPACAAETAGEPADDEVVDIQEPDGLHEQQQSGGGWNADGSCYLAWGLGGGHEVCFAWACNNGTSGGWCQ